MKDFGTVERSRTEYALLGFIVLIFVFGVAKLLGQTGLVAGWGVLLTYLAEPAGGSVRQRAGNMGAFAIFGFIQILLVALVGGDTLGLLLLLFVVSFISSWMMGYGGRAALVGFVSNIWITLMPPLGVAANLGPSLVGYSAGCLLVIAASTIPAYLRSKDKAVDDPSQLSVFEPRQYNRSTLFGYSLIRALGITLAGFIGYQYLQLNQLWIALTVNLIMPPVDTAWKRGMHRAVGTVLGAIAGFILVQLAGDNTNLLLLFEAIAALLMLYSAKGFGYSVFVFFLSIFIVTQLGLKGVDMAQFGGIERIIATLIGVTIAFGTMLILRIIVKRDTFVQEPAAA